jgi:RsiW-degrading membrane proteinase PrsW (M82 family)
MDELVKLNEQLMGAPSGILLAAFAIALGYVLKFSQFPNNRIPLVVVVVCTIGFMLIAPDPGEIKPRIWLVRNFIIGFIIGFVAWTFHAQILRRFVDPKLFPQDSLSPLDQRIAKSVVGGGSPADVVSETSQPNVGATPPGGKT